MWRQWLAACRYCFNQAMAWLKNNGKLVAKRKLRNIIMQSDLPEWVKQSPCHIRQNAIFDAYGAYKASKKAKFRSCRERNQTIKFNNSNFSNGRWYPKLSKGLEFKASEPIPDNCSLATGLTANLLTALFSQMILKPITQNYSLVTILQVSSEIRNFKRIFGNFNYNF